MKGTRVESDVEMIHTPGSYMLAHDGYWHCCTPNGLIGNLAHHDVTEHEDGTISVSPSILVKSYDDRPSYHGFLERGEWREV